MDGRNGWVGFILFLLCLCVIGVAMLGKSLQEGMTERAKAKERAETAAAQYEYFARKAELDADLDRIILASQAHEQRIATLAVALAGLDDDEAKLLRLYDELARPNSDAWLVVLGGFFGLLAGLGIILGLHFFGEKLKWAVLSRLEWGDGP